MSEILFLAHRIPFPPDRGDKIRSNHVLKALCHLARVHVACFADDAADAAETTNLAALAASCRVVHRRKSMLRAGLEALACGAPASVTAFHDRALAAYVEQVLARRPISAIYVFSGQMGQYVPADFRGRVIMDFVDVDSAKFEAYALASRWPMRWVYARENRLLRNEEARLAACADHCLLISQAEAALFGLRLSPEERAACHIGVIGNGIDSDTFDPAHVSAEPALAEYGAPRLIFTGQMDYAPNVVAAIRAIDRIMPLVRAQLPDASLHIVGRNPTSELSSRDGVNGARVWGRVDDIRTWLKGADMALVPLEIARGVQNKVLEAMSMALPVVLTQGAATGIAGDNGRQFLVSDADDMLAAAVIALACDPARSQAMGQAARRQVVTNASWQAALAGLPELLGLSRGRSRDAA